MDAMQSVAKPIQDPAYGIAAQATPEKIFARSHNLLIWVAILCLVYLMLVAVATISSGFSLAAGGREGAERLFAFANTPLTGLLIGILATSLVQSSSTVSSIIVGLVAGGLPIGTAIPMIMGANIGTTITNTLVSLGHINQGKAFQRAFAAALVHDCFNLLAVAIFLPLEILTGFLERSAEAISMTLVSGLEVDLIGLNFIKAITTPPVNLMRDLLVGLPEVWAGIFCVTIGMALIFFAISLMSKLLRKILAGRAKRILHKTINHSPVSGICSGLVVTVMVQSSSTTTSLAVPLAGARIFRISEIYPFMLGANIGTTVTGLLAATAFSDPVALQIALVHLLFNVAAVTLIYGLKTLRVLPIHAAKAVAKLATKRKSLALAYIVTIFFALPALVVYCGSIF